MRGKEVALTKELAQRGPSTFAYLKGSVHQQFSDTPLWFPVSIGRSLKTTGTCDRHQAFKAMHALMCLHIAGTSVHVKHDLLCYGYEIEESNKAESTI